MVIFSRRTLQRIIGENASFLSKKQLEKHIEMLNKNDISYEWEVVLLNVFSKLGKVVHEPKFENCNRKIDILFNYKNADFEFLADITCVLGKKDDDNLIVSFERELKTIIDQNNLSGFWSIHVGGSSWEVDFLKLKPRLKLPTKGEFTAKVFDTQNFKRFLDNVKKNPESKDDCFFENPEIILSIKYKPRPYFQMYSSHFDDTTIVSISQNSIYRSLRAKYDQLKEAKKAGYEGNLGIIICDGTGNTFNKIGELSAYNAGDVVYEFLHNHTEIGFVLTVNSKVEPHNFSARMPQIKIDLYEGSSFDKIRNETAQLFQNDLAENFPQPVRSALDAKNFLNIVKQNLQEIYSKGHFGFTVSDYELKISPRTLLELLSGKLTQEKFIKTYQMKDDNYVYNFISEMIQEGRLITESSIEKSEYEQDDDWIVFRFGETDAAVSSFKMPDKEK